MSIMAHSLFFGRGGGDNTRGEALSATRTVFGVGGGGESDGIC